MPPSFVCKYGCLTIDCAVYDKSRVFYAQSANVVICQGNLDRGATQEKDFQGIIHALTLEVE